MKKFLIKYTIIIFINLFAFLSVGFILDELLKVFPKFTILFLLLSIVSLVFISFRVISKTLKDLNDIKEKNASK